MGRRLTAVQPVAVDMPKREAAVQMLEEQEGLVMGGSTGLDEGARFAHSGSGGGARQLMQFTVQPAAVVNRTSYLVRHRLQLLANACDADVYDGHPLSTRPFIRLTWLRTPQ